MSPVYVPLYAFRKSLFGIQPLDFISPCIAHQQDENFVGTLETVRSREVSVARGSTVFLFFFDSFSLLSYFIFKCVLKIILSIISAAVLLIETRWVRMQADVTVRKL